MNQQALVESKSMREERIKDSRSLDVLDEVKDIMYLGSNEKVTMPQVVDYYGVNGSTVRQNIKRHRDEFEEDGLEVIKDEVLAKFKSYLKNNDDIERNRWIYDKIKRSPSLTVFTKQALLRLGMLLRDSEVAKQIRSYLINLESVATESQKEEAANKTPDTTKVTEMVEKEDASVYDLMDATKVLYKSLEQQAKMVEKQKELEDKVEKQDEKIEKLKGKIDIAPNSDDLRARAVAQQLGVTSPNGIPHSQLVGTIARSQFGMNNKVKSPYQDDDVKVCPNGSQGLAAYYTPQGINKIKNWFEENKDDVKYQKYYKHNSKYGDAGDLKEAGYEINGTRFKTFVARINNK